MAKSHLQFTPANIALCFILLLVIALLAWTATEESQKNISTNKNVEKIVAKYDWFKPIAERVSQGDSLTTHPAFRSGSITLIDSDLTIENLPKKGDPVWVEKVVSPNELILSYPVVQLGESVITFGAFRLATLNSLSDNKCQEKESVTYIKSLVENKFMLFGDILSSDIAKNNRIQATFFIPNDETTDSSLKKLAEQTDNPLLNIEQAILFAGYGRVAGPMGVPDYWRNIATIEDSQEVAQIAKRGFWKVCE